MPEPSKEATCIVTGASSGIGEAIARELAARGHGVTLVARRGDRLAALAEELSNRHGVQASAFPCDLSDARGRSELLQSVDDAGQEVGVLICNAGLASAGRFIELDSERELQQVKLLCECVVDLSRPVAASMAKRRRGAILIVSSVSGFGPTPNTATYGAAKAFSLSFGQALHAELRGAGVAVSVLSPGPVRTEIFDGLSHPSERLPRAVWQNPAQVARAGVAGLDSNRRVVVPGSAMRAVVVGSRLVPIAVRLPVLDRFYR